MFERFAVSWTRRQTLGLMAGGVMGGTLAGWRGAGPNGALPRTGEAATPAAGAAPPIVLVHGSFLGGWCWDEVAPALAAAGREAVTLDLPGHGDDETPVAEITLRSYVDRVLEAVDAQPAPVVLVGHSMGGVVISEVAERRPDQVAALAYLGAYLLDDGESMLDAALSDADSLLGPKFHADPDAGVGTVPSDVFAASFFHDCPAAAVERAMPRVRPEPLAPLATPVALTAENFGRIPRYSLETLLDRVVSLPLQRRMQAAVPGSRISALATGHAPFFAQPGQLASLLGLL